MRKVINKMVSEEDLIRTVATAYGNGWRQVKLYFMCGLPTETDEDVLQIAELAHEGHQGRPGGDRHEGHPLHRLDRRVRAQAAHPVPVGGAARPRGDRRAGCGKLKRRDPRRPQLRQGDRLPLPRRQARHRSRACSPAATAGSARSSARSGRTAAASTAGASTSPTTAGWTRADEALADVRRGRRLVHHPGARATPRSCPGTTSTPAWTRTGSGRTGRTRSTEVEVRTAAGRRASTAASARSMDTEIQIGPTGREAAAADRGRLGLAARARTRPSRRGGQDARGPAAAPGGAAAAAAVRQARAGCGSPPTATSRGRSSGRCAGPACRWRTPPGFTPHPKISYAGAAPDRGGQRGRVPGDRRWRERCDPDAAAGRARRGAAARPGRARGGRGRPPGAAPTGSRRRVWGIELPGVAAGRLRHAAVDAFLAADGGRGRAADQERACARFDARAAVLRPGRAVRAPWR